jgi:hypothetical protein
MDNKITFRMSSAGKCPRALSAQYLDYEAKPAPEWLARAAYEGRMHENIIIEDLTIEGYNIDSRQQELVLDYPEFTLTGHIDGIIYSLSSEGAKLLEIKTMSQFEFNRWMRGKFSEFPQYEAQLACYLTATALPEALYLVKNRNTGSIYRNTYALSSLVPTFNTVLERLGKAAESINKDELVPATFDPQSVECKRCNYQKLCITEPSATEVDLPALDKAVETWREGKELSDRGKALTDEARVILNEYARKFDAKRFVHNKLSVQLINQHRVSYDKKLLEQHVSSTILDYTKVEKDIETIRITDLEDK